MTPPLAAVATVTDITCEQLAILEMGSPTLGHHATSLTQSVWASSFSSVTQLSLSSLMCGEGSGREGRDEEERGGERRDVSKHLSVSNIPAMMHSSEQTSATPSPPYLDKVIPSSCYQPLHATDGSFGTTLSGEEETH